MRSSAEIYTIHRSDYGPITFSPSIGLAHLSWATAQLLPSFFDPSTRPVLTGATTGLQPSRRCRWSTFHEVAWPRCARSTITAGAVHTAHDGGSAASGNECQLPPWTHTKSTDRSSSLAHSATLSNSHGYRLLSWHWQTGGAGVHKSTTGHAERHAGRTGASQSCCIATS